MLEMYFHEISEHSFACKVVSEKILVTHSHHTLAVIDNSIYHQLGPSRPKEKVSADKARSFRV